MSASPVWMPTRMWRSSHSSSVSQVHDRLPDGEAGANGSLGVVLVCLGRAEQRQHGVAAELLERAAMAFELCPDTRVVGRDEYLTSSGSSCWDRAVEPTRSTKIAVMTFRSSLGGAAGGASTSAFPHAEQKRACTGFSVPHSVQKGMGEGYDGGPFPTSRLSRDARIRTADLLLPKQAR